MATQEGTEEVQRQLNIAALAAIGGCVLAVAGCGSSSSSSTSSTAAAGASSTPAATTPASGSDPVAAAQAKIAAHTAMPQFSPPGPAFDAAKAKGETVWVVPTASNIPLVPLVDNAMQQALALSGVKTHAVTTTGTTADWVNGMNQAVDQGAGAIVLLSVDPKLLGPQIAAATKAHIPVVWNFAVAGDVKQIQPDIAASVPLPFPDSARLIADDAIVETKGKAHILPVGTAEVRQDKQMLDAQAEELKTVCPDCKAEKPINAPLPDWATRMGDAVRTTLLGNSDINFVTPNYDGMEQFIAPAIRQANPSGSIKTASFNGTPSVLKEIGKGIVTADVGQSNRWIGWATADQVLRVMTGTAPVADEKIPVRVWNASNISEATGPNAENGYGDSYVAGYKKLWGVAG
jgi:ribose transport system substrate-binding protein